MPGMPILELSSWSGGPRRDPSDTIPSSDRFGWSLLPVGYRVRHPRG
jgi:hypothetical protein